MKSFLALSVHKNRILKVRLGRIATKFNKASVCPKEGTKR